MNTTRSSLQVRSSLLALVTLALAASLSACSTAPSAPPAALKAQTIFTVDVVPSTFTYARLANPARTVVTDDQGAWVATFTDGASTVVMRGANRTFAEPSGTAATVTHDRYVRLLDAPFDGTVDDQWLSNALATSSPDVLAVAMQYVAGAPSLYDAQNVRVAGDADYGPLLPSGERQEGSDFNDYLGLSWTYPSGVDKPEADQFGSLDCSGFVRMVFGYRSGMGLSDDMDGVHLPRRAVMQAASAPGLMIIADSGARATAYGDLQIGDLVFFDVSKNDGAQIDHVGIYLGVDSQGHFRFISSRKGANGPTMGDVQGASRLDPVGSNPVYSVGFRAARRL